MKTKETKILGELHYKGKRMAFRLFRDWAVWRLLKLEFRNQYAKNAGVKPENVTMSAWQLNIEV